MALSNQSVVIDILGNIAGFVSDMKRAQREIDKQGEDLEKRAKAWGKAIGGALASAATALVTGTQLAINEMDKLGDRVKKVGIGAESLSALGFAAKQSGVEVGTLDTSLVKLARNMTDAAGGGSVAEVFKTIGVSVTDANGRLRATEEVLVDVANRFRGFEDGAAKVALATKLFGQAGAEILPLLDEMDPSLAAIIERARQYGAVVGQDAVDAAQRFNDNLDILRTQFNAIFIGIAQELLPVLIQLSQTFITTGKDSDAASSSVSAFADGLKTILKFAVYLNAAFQTVGKTIGGMLADIANNAEALGKILSGNVLKAAEGIAQIKPALGVGDDVAAVWDLARQRIAALNGELATTVGLFANVKGGGTSTAKSVAELAAAAEKAARRAKELAAEQKRAAEEAKRLAEESKRLHDEFTDSLADLEAELSGPMAQAQLAYSRQIENLQVLLDKGIITVEEATIAQAAYGEAFERTTDKIRRQLAPAEQLIDDLKFELSLIGLTNVAREKEIALRHLAGEATAEQAEEIENLLVQLEQKTAESDAARQFQSMWENAIDSVAGAFAGFIDGSTKSFKDLGRQLIDIAKRFLAQLVQMFIATQLRVNMGANMSTAGGMGGAGGVSGGMMQMAGNFLLGGNGTGFALGQGALGQLGGYAISNAAGTGYGMFGTQAAWNAAAANGPPAALAGSGVGWGGMATGALGIGAGLGALYWGASTGNPVWGAAGGAAGAMMAGAGLSAMGFAQAGALVGGPVGIVVGLIIGAIAAALMKEKPPSLDIIGSSLVGQAPYRNLAPGMTFDSALGGGAIASIDSVSREARDKFILGIQQFDAAIAQFLSPEQLAEVKQRIATSSQTFREGAITVENILGGRLSMVLQSVAPEVAAYVESLEGIEEQINGFGAAMTVWRDFSTTNTLGLETFAETMEALEDFRNEGENLGQTIARFVPAVAFMDAALEQFGQTFEGTRRQFLQFTDDFLTLIGGMDRAAQLFNNAFTAVFTPAEIAQMNYESAQAYATEQFEDIGLGPNATRAEIREVIERALRTGDEALLKEALEAAEAFGFLGQALDNLNQATGQATDGVILLGQALDPSHNFLPGGRPGNGWQVVDLDGTDNPVEAVEEFAAATISAGQAALEAAAAQDELADTFADLTRQIEDAIRGIKEWLDRQRFDDTSTLTPAQRLAEAQRQFDVNLLAAQAGDIDALRNLTGFADRFLQEGRSFYSSSDAYTQIESRVRAALEALVANPPQPPRQISPDTQAIVDTIERESNIDRLRYEEMIALLADVADETGDGNGLLQRIIDARAGRLG